MEPCHVIATVQVPRALRAAPWEGSVCADPTSSVAGAADARLATMDSHFASYATVGNVFVMT